MAGVPDENNAFQPGPIRRTQTGHEFMPETMEAAELDSRPLGNEPEEQRSPSSFAMRVQREMRADEGRALMDATLNGPPR